MKTLTDTIQIYKLIYERAAQKGVTIECAPSHRHNRDYIGAGVRLVKFPDNNRSYKYRDTLVNIAIRLELITEVEYEAYLLQDEKLQRCPDCGKITGKETVRTFNKCLNC